jgi:putative peptide zinc metalloprotease protein
LGRFLNPFAIKVPLLDPERFLERTLPYVRPLIGWFGVVLWFAVVVPALLGAFLHWPELSEGFVDRVLTPQNVFVIWLIFPVIKAFHELGHGYMAKAFGGEVHDIGIMFLVFSPIPYVDASSASAFPERHRRALVGAAGMIVEVFIAALAYYVWANAEAGLVRAVAFNTMLIGGVTTVAFNGNPLLRFDGYYILADLLEIPNLRARSNAYLGYLFERYALGHRKADRPETTEGEPSWLVGYAVASFVYRMLIIVAIFLFVLEISLILGVVMVALSLVGWVGVPLAKAFRFLVADARTKDVRGRASLVLGGLAAGAVLLLFVVPMPYRTVAEGVVWVPEETLVRAETDGFIERVVAPPGSVAKARELLFQCSDPDLETEVAVLEARSRVLRARYYEEIVVSKARAQIVAEEQRRVAERLAWARDRQQGLAIRSGVEGVFLPIQPEDLPGRFVQKGQPLAHLLQDEPLTVRAVVNEDDIDLVRLSGTVAQVRFAEHFGDVLKAGIERIEPTASTRLPSSALGSVGGGRIAIDPRDERGLQAVHNYFVVELKLPPGPVAELGGRVYVRFAHPPRPLAAQWYRGVRQIFLSRLDV